MDLRKPSANSTLTSSTESLPTTVLEAFPSAPIMLCASVCQGSFCMAYILYNSFYLPCSSVFPETWTIPFSSLYSQLYNKTEQSQLQVNVCWLSDPLWFKVTTWIWVSESFPQPSGLNDSEDKANSGWGFQAVYRCSLFWGIHPGLGFGRDCFYSGPNPLGSERGRTGLCSSRFSLWYYMHSEHTCLSTGP